MLYWLNIVSSQSAIFLRSQVSDPCQLWVKVVGLGKGSFSMGSGLMKVQDIDLVGIMYCRHSVVIVGFSDSRKVFCQL